MSDYIAFNHFIPLTKTQADWAMKVSTCMAQISEEADICAETLKSEEYEIAKYIMEDDPGCMFDPGFYSTREPDGISLRSFDSHDRKALIRYCQALIKKFDLPPISISASADLGGIAYFITKNGYDEISTEGWLWDKEQEYRREILFRDFSDLKKIIDKPGGCDGDHIFCRECGHNRFTMSAMETSEHTLYVSIYDCGQFDIDDSELGDGPDEYDYSNIAICMMCGAAYELPSLRRYYPQKQS